MQHNSICEKYKGNWYSFNIMNIEQKGKDPYEYEYITRTQRSCRGGVEVVPIIKKEGKLYLLLIKNFRYPINAYCLEFPGGIIDEGETLEEAAARELREETGYIINKILSVQPEIQVDPWKSDDTNNIVIGLVDGDAEENLVTQNQLDHIEKIEPIIVEWDNLEKQIEELSKEYRIMNSIGYFLTFKKMYSLINNI